jgi:outer membrane protein assembly factor BamB
VNGSFTFLRRNQLATVALAVVGFCVAARADWLHYRGPTMNGISPEKGLNTTFPADGPKILWRAELGTGTSAVTVKGGRVFSMGHANEKDIVYCFDARTGSEVWRHTFPLALDPKNFEGGPRATPTLDGNRVFTVSHQGDLWCLDAASGKKIWYKHYQKDFGGRRPEWGYAGSPTVDGNLLILDVGAKGGSTVALDKATGNVVWKSGNDESGYGSVVVATIGGKKTAIIFKASHLVGLDAANGRELWRFEWKTDYDVNAATPVVVGDRVLISSGYNHGAALVAIRGGKAQQVWMNKNLREHFNSPLVWQGAIYGIDGNEGGGNLVSLDLETGQQNWVEKSVKGGSLILADGKLIVLTEKGDLVIADATPASFHQLSRAHIVDKRCWVQPTLDAGRVFLRNNAGAMVCIDLGAK